VAALYRAESVDAVSCIVHVWPFSRNGGFGILHSVAVDICMQPVS
jgi:hypothetical protein